MTDTMSAVTDETSENEMPDQPKRPSRLEERRAVRAASPARAAVSELAESRALDELFAKIATGAIDLTGDGGFVTELIKATLERGLAAELTDHLGYEKGAVDAAAFANSRNGSTPKTVATGAGDVDLRVPRDRDGTFTPRLVPTGSRRLGGLDDIIISLYAGGMTVRDIAHHLEATLGTELVNASQGRTGERSHQSNSLGYAG